MGTKQIHQVRRIGLFHPYLAFVDDSVIVSVAQRTGLLNAKEANNHPCISSSSPLLWCSFGPRFCTTSDGC